ncbi:MAG: hypothetical protein ABW220_13295 [Burkholderiaceae bacterium]
MSAAVYLLDGGAVTAVGLDRPQTCAGIRARVTPFQLILRSSPFGAEQAVARVPTHWGLRKTPADWLIHMAARAVREVLDRRALDAASVTLLMIPPEPFRQALFDGIGPDEAGRHWTARFADHVASRLALRFRRVITLDEGGAGAMAAALTRAQAELQDPDTFVLLASADGYVMEPEFDRLDRAQRLRTAGRPQGLTPGEGAACVLLSASSAIVPESRRPAGDPWLRVPSMRPLRLLGWAGRREKHSALTDAQSQGAALLEAMREAAGQSGTAEPAFGWVVSNSNGERYMALEDALAHSRYFRTRRERLHIELPAASVGEIGAAGGPLALLAAAHRLKHAGVSARRVMAALSAEDGQRSACVLAPLEQTS